MQTEIESHKSELARELTSLRSLVASPELAPLRDARAQLAQQVGELQAELRAKAQAHDEKDQAVSWLALFGVRVLCWELLHAVF